VTEPTPDPDEPRDARETQNAVAADSGASARSSGPPDTLRIALAFGVVAATIEMAAILLLFAC
jgi:hypothetical protein